ncbi:hypothetical protein MPSEU_000720200 [Mayamaea pseudoterrestris]|nr:hypothetical protein MPSEU_000720200 [Mayamaea pseudoterrestris]
MRVHNAPRILGLAAFAFNSAVVESFTISVLPRTILPKSSTHLSLSTKTVAGSFIETELRGAAMRLHTRSQAPKEGEAAETPKKDPYVTTRSDYLQFLVDSKHVYEAMEEIVNDKDELKAYRNTGLERTTALDTDFAFMIQEYGLERPSVRPSGVEYATKLRSIQSIPEFMCHFYNFYFAHTAGGRMIGKQMSSLLLNKKTLEFYKWKEDLNAIKARVKQSIEEMAASWSPDERLECVDATAEAFRLGGGINSALAGGQSTH